jgi:hypothetical protein
MTERRFALLVASNQYDDPDLAQLIAPPKDVEALAQVLRNRAIGRFGEVNTLVNEPYITVRDAIAGFFHRKKKDDLLLLYFSGHGLLDDRGRLYLAVKDTNHALLRARAIPATDITDEIDNSRSRRQVLILDCCHSGAFDRTKAGLGASVGTANTFEGSGYGRVVLAASDVTQYAWEGDQAKGEPEQSVFTHYLVQGLRTGAADADGDGWITLDEWYDYAYAQVVQTAKQTPGKWAYKEQGEIVVARNPNPIVKEAELPAELQTAAKPSPPPVTLLISRMKKDPDPQVRREAALSLARTDIDLCTEHLNEMLKSGSSLEQQVALEAVAYIQVTDPVRLELAQLDVDEWQWQLRWLRWLQNRSVWRKTTLYSALGGSIGCISGGLMSVIFFGNSEALEQAPIGVMFALMVGLVMGASIGFGFGSVEATKEPRHSFLYGVGAALCGGIAGMLFGLGDLEPINASRGALVGLTVGLTSGILVVIIINSTIGIVASRMRLAIRLMLGLVAATVPATICALAASLDLLPLQLIPYGLGLGLLLPGMIGGLEYAQRNLTQIAEATVP